MKIVLIDFKQVDPKGQDQKNVATVRITEYPKKLGVDSEVDSIRFKMPVRCIKEGQLRYLMAKVDAAVHGSVPAEHSEPVAVPSAAAALANNKGVHGFAAFVKNMFEGKKKHMSPEDQKLADNALTMVDKLLGKGK
jgi:hypothetical protein